MARRYLFTLLLILFTLIVAAQAAPPAQALSLSVQDDPLFLASSGPQRDVYLDKVKSLGAKTIRVNLQWDRVVNDPQSMTVPATINYNLAALDSLQQAAAVRGLKLRVTLTGNAPAWATSNHVIGGRDPSPALFAAYARAVATYFKGRISSYAIWNEPNLSIWLSSSSESKVPGLYRALYTQAYGAIKTADPAAQVFIGETSPYKISGHASYDPLAFMRAVACVNKKYRRIGRCAQLKTDGYAHHPYNFLKKPSTKTPGADKVTIGTLSRLTAALKKLKSARALVPVRGKAIPVYLTEYGYFASGARKKPLATRVSWWKQSATLARKAGAKELLVYMLLQRPDAHWNTGVLRPDGQPDALWRTLQGIGARR